MSIQNPSALVMVRPASFGSNPQTIGSNSYQASDEGMDEDEMNELARGEFDQMVDRLREAGIVIHVFEDRTDPVCPDAVFPNNWFSTHNDGTLALYPMMAKNRRTERRNDIVDELEGLYTLKQVISFSPYERGSRFLEGTGSIVFDHINRQAYACRSPRTQQDIFRKSCETLGYEPILFEARDADNNLIYHTNVMMWIGENLAGICPDAIRERERESVMEAINASGRTIITLSQEQVASFAGNMLEVTNKEGKNYLVMSQSAWDCLDKGQQETIEKNSHPLPVSLGHIEKYSGGSARCMMAGIHLPNKLA